MDPAHSLDVSHMLIPDFEGIAAAEAQAYADSLPPGTSSQTLLAVLQRRLEEQNQVFGTYVGEITANTDKADEVLGIMQELLVLKGEGEATGNGDLGAREHTAIVDAERARLGREPTSAEIGTAFNAYVADLVDRARAVGLTLTLPTRNTDSSGAPSPVWMVAGPILTGIESAKQRLQEINSGNELQMIRLQDVMQSRSSDVQLFTNLLKQLSDTQMGVIRNISG